MLVVRQSQLLQEAPPQDLPRIFVGNLTEHVLDSSLHQLLSRFGTISNFSRSKCSTFAHISLRADETSITKCISSLNRVKWFGTSLRVEKARQHYLNRLREEWKLRSCAAECLSTETNGEQETASKPPFHNFPKGRHIRFSFPDEPLHLPSHSVPSEIEDQLDEPLSRPVRIRSSAFASKQNSLQTTLSLFGLNASQDIDHSKPTKRSLQEMSPSGGNPKRSRCVQVETDGDSKLMKPERENDGKPGENTHSEDTCRDIKSKRDSPEGTVDTKQPYSKENAEAVEEDPSKIDMERERSSHLQVFRSLFPNQVHLFKKSERRNVSRGDMVENKLFTRYRRAALYTMLQTPGTDKLPLQSTKSTGSKSKRETTKDTRQVLERDPEQYTTFAASYRKVALYKKLQLVQHSDAV